MSTFQNCTSTEDIARMLESGVCPDVVFELAEDWLSAQATQCPNDLAEAFANLIEYKYSVEIIKEWLKEHMNAELAYDIVDYNWECWERIGIEPRDFMESWICYYGDKCLREDFKMVPETMMPEELIDHYTIDEILEMRDGDFYGFIEDYVNEKGKIDFLAKKYLKEVGYTKESFENLAYLLIFKATVIYYDKLFENVPEDVDEDLASSLEDLGVPSEYIDKIR